jgi:hypothetical protein
MLHHPPGPLPWWALQKVRWQPSRRWSTNSVFFGCGRQGRALPEACQAAIDRLDGYRLTGAAPRSRQRPPKLGPEIPLRPYRRFKARDGSGR